MQVNTHQHETPHLEICAVGSDVRRCCGVEGVTETSMFTSRNVQENMNNNKQRPQQEPRKKQAESWKMSLSSLRRHSRTILYTVPRWFQTRQPVTRLFALDKPLSASEVAGDFVANQPTPLAIEREWHIQSKQQVAHKSRVEGPQEKWEGHKWQWDGRHVCSAFVAVVKV